MANEIVLGIRLKADGGDLVGTVKVSEDALKKLREETGKNTSEAAKLNTEHKNLASTMNTSASSIGAYTALWTELSGWMVKAASAAAGYIKETALLAARHETLGVVMQVVGRNAGYTASEMNTVAEAVRNSGITMIESRETVIKLAQANIDLSLATKLARAAQDAAVIANTNSSEALERLIHGIVSGQTDVLRTMGINVQFEDSYKKLAAQLKINVDQLTEQEKTQARANVVLEYATRLQGTYEAAMGTAGKQLNSLKRFEEDLKTVRGQVWNDALIIAVEAYTGALKDANKQSQDLANNGTLKEWGRDIVRVFAAVADAIIFAKDVFFTFTDKVAAGAARGTAAISNVVLSEYSPTGYVLKKMGYRPNQVIQDAAESIRSRAASNERDRFDLWEDGRLGKYSNAADARFAARDAADREAARQRSEDDRDVSMARLMGLGARGGASSARSAAGRSGGAADPYSAAKSTILSLENQLATAGGETSEFDKVMREITDGTKKWTDALIAHALALAGEIDLTKQAKVNLDAYLKRLEFDLQIEKEIADIEVKKSEAAAKANMAAYESAEAIRFETSLIGLNNVEREKAIALRTLEADRAKLTATEYERNAKAITDAIEARGSAQEYEDRRKQALEDEKRIAQDVGRSLTDAIMNGGVKGFRDLGKIALRMFEAMVLRPRIEPQMQALASGANKLIDGALSGLLGFAGANTSWLADSFSAGAVSNAVIASGIMHGGHGPGDTISEYRAMAASAMARAPRYHAGIGPGEQAAVIRKDESVLTPGQMRQLAPAHPRNVRVEIINESGTPVQSTQANATFDAEGMMVRVVLADLRRGGPVAQGIGNTFGLSRAG